MTVNDLMQADMLTAQTSERVSSVAYNMANNQVGAALVVSGTRLVQIFTERDLLNKVIAEGRDLEETLVEEVATENPITVSSGDSIIDAIGLMQKNNIRHLPVIDNEGQPVGILSSRDIFKLINPAEASALLSVK